MPVDAVRSGRILDVSRLLARMQRNTPTGIDRVEFAYARHYLERARFLMTTPVNTGFLPSDVARHVVRTATERWSASQAEPAAERTFRMLIDFLRSPIQPSRPTVRVIEPPGGIRDHATSTVIGTAYLHAFSSGLRDPRHSGADGAWYLHVSHINLHKPSRLNWIRYSAVRAMFMVHDLIPITHPEYFPPEEARKHRRRIETVTRLGSLVIFNSAATKAVWDDYLSGKRLPRPAGAVVRLGVDPLFCDRVDGGNSAGGGTPYFVVVGTVEARKNLSFLLHAWREWVRRSEKPQARLVIIGRRGDAGESALDLLDRCPALASTVIEVAELADSRVARLLKGAQALLAPSLIEGFGLPIAEALAVGLPVIASDIGAHREAGGDAAEYLDPQDMRAWMQALDDFVGPSSVRREAALGRAAAQKPRSWDDHIGEVEALLQEQQGTPT